MPPRLSYIRVKNFGPISEASINFRSITILTGPYNTGKTYLATLAHLLTKITSYTLQLIDLSDVLLKRRIYGRFHQEKARKMLREHLDEIKELTTNILKRNLPHSLSREFSEHFAIFSPSELVSWGSNSAYIETSSKVGNRMIFKIAFEIEKTSGKIKIKDLIISDYAIEYLIRSIRVIDVRESSVSISFAGFRGFWEPIYIPAERLFLVSNIHSLLQLIIETHGARALGYDIAQRYTLQRIKGLMRPILLTYLTRLLSNLKGKKAHKIERTAILRGIDELIDGDVRFDKDTLAFFYKRKGGHEVPLAGASSGVSQLVALIFSLPSDMESLQSTPLIIIEEPEINLHANHQLKVAEFLAKLCQHTNLLLTTHSEYMLEKLAHLWADGKIPSFNAYFLDPETQKAEKIKTKKETGEIELIKTINEAVEVLAGEALRLMGGRKNKSNKV